MLRTVICGHARSRPLQGNGERTAPKFTFPPIPDFVLPVGRSTAARGWNPAPTGIFFFSPMRQDYRFSDFRFPTSDLNNSEFRNPNSEFVQSSALFAKSPLLHVQSANVLRRFTADCDIVLTVVQHDDGRAGQAVLIGRHRIMVRARCKAGDDAASDNR